MNPDLPRHRSTPPAPSTRATTATGVRLRADVPVLPRGDGLVQVGSDPTRRVLLPDTASVRRLLQVLPLGVLPDASDGSPEVLRALRAAELLVDERERRLLAEARSATRVRVTAPARWQAVAVETLSAAGLTPLDGSGTPEVTLVVTWGEPDRSGLDLLTARDEPWLPVTVLEGRVRVGPFVVPGTSACLRCVDAHEAAADPWHRIPPTPDPAASGVATPDALEEAVDPLVLRHGLLTAVTDVARWAEGRQPLTWSATRTHRSSMLVEPQQWSQHPHCGCSWGDDVATG